MAQGSGPTIVITQENASQASAVLGSWTLIQPNNVRISYEKKAQYEYRNAETGMHTLLIEPPEGMSTVVEVMMNGESVSTSDTPQANFTLAGADAVTVKIVYEVALSGMVSVNSEPGGISFVLSGPDGWKKTGSTPASFDGVPIGQYSVTYRPPESCGDYKPKSDKLVNKGRISFGIDIICEELEQNGSENTEKKLTHVTVLIDGKTVVFEDVPLDQWFSQYVHQAAKTGIMSGYGDANGNPTGVFAPSETVTMAQLSKIAVKLAGINESEYRGSSKNPSAAGTWFEPYFRVAETLGWQVFHLDARLDPARPATRAEVIATIMQALDVPRAWPEAKLFTDVGFTTRFADCIETAARDGLADGYRDENGASTGLFGPENPVNRAEMAKIIATAMELYIEDSPSIQAGSR